MRVREGVCLQPSALIRTNYNVISRQLSRTLRGRERTKIVRDVVWFFTIWFFTIYSTYESHYIPFLSAKALNHRLALVGEFVIIRQKKSIKSLNPEHE